MNARTPPETLRRAPYVWVTWLTRLLSGEDNCWWKTWYRAHYKYSKIPQSAERQEFLAEWTERHDEMVQARVQSLREAGAEVRVEDEAAFTVVGRRGATLSGKPDYVATRNGIALIGEAKAGAKRQSDRWQVLIYAWALPLAWLRGVRPMGELVYRNGPIAVQAPSEQDVARIGEALRRVTGDAELARAPSARECRFCDVAACPARILEAEAGDAAGIF